MPVPISTGTRLPSLRKHSLSWGWTAPVVSIPPRPLAVPVCHPGGVKQRTAGQILDGRFPQRVLEKAVERMLPKESPLARKQLTHLKVYNSAEHPHEAQNPEVVDFKGANSKNVRSQ